MTQEWLRKAHVAEHEAAHAVAALKMGLPVEWVTVNPGCDEGINFMAAVKISDELIDRADTKTVFAICVAMAAPSHIHNHIDWPIGRYAQQEYQLALEMAGMAGIEAGEVYDRSEEIVREHYVEIFDLAHRLKEEGTVTFDAAPV